MSERIIVDSPGPKPKAHFDDLRTFLSELEAHGELKRIDVPVDPNLELTEVCRRTLEQGGPALLFTQPTDAKIPILANLFGTQQRIAAALGAESTNVFEGLGQLLASLRAPEPPRGLGDAWQKLPLVKEILNMAPRLTKNAPWKKNDFY